MTRITGFAPVSNTPNTADNPTPVWPDPQYTTVDPWHRRAIEFAQAGGLPPSKPPYDNMCKVGDAQLWNCTHYTAKEGRKVKNGFFLSGAVRVAGGEVVPTRQSTVYFHRNGQAGMVDISENQTVQGIPCKGNWEGWNYLIFFDNGMLGRATLASEHEFQLGDKKITLPKDTAIARDEKGRLRGFKAPKGVKITFGDKTYEGGEMHTFDEKGNETSPTANGLEEWTPKEL